VTAAEFFTGSKRRLALTIAVPVMGMVLIVVSATNQGGPATTGAPTPTRTVESVSPSTGPAVRPQAPQSVTVHPPLSPTAVPPAGDRRPATGVIQRNAVRYLATFLDQKMPAVVRIARLRAMSTATHAAVLATVPRSSVPRTTVAGPVTLVRVGEGRATVRQALADGTVLLVVLVLDFDGWKVSRVVPQAVTR
jgi:hypothetical protein